MIKKKINKNKETEHRNSCYHDYDILRLFISTLVYYLEVKMIKILENHY